MFEWAKRDEVKTLKSTLNIICTDYKKKTKHIIIPLKITWAKVQTANDIINFFSKYLLLMFQCLSCLKQSDWFIDWSWTCPFSLRLWFIFPQGNLDLPMPSVPTPFQRMSCKKPAKHGECWGNNTELFDWLFSGDADIDSNILDMWFKSLLTI